MRSKVTIVGAGNVGATTAQRIFDKGYADVVLVDIVEGLPQGKALDMLEAGPVVGSDSTVLGTNGYEETAGSDIVVITSGIARKPGMSRDDLLLTNMKIVTSVVKEVVKHSPDCILLPVTNPLDAMAQRTFQVSRFPKSRVVGMAGVLDTARFRTFLAEELAVSVESISAYVLGGHGDTMVPVVGSTTVGGRPVADLLPPERVSKRSCSAPGTAAPRSSVCSRPAAPTTRPRRPSRRWSSRYSWTGSRCSPAPRTWRGSTGSTGYSSAYRSSWGSSGIEEVIEFDLTPDELAELRRSADAVRELVRVMEQSG